MPYAGTSEVRKAKHAAYMRKWLAENPEKHSQHLELVTANKKRYRQQRQEMLDKFRAQGCVACGEMEPACIDAHHTDPKVKGFTLASGKTAGVAPGAFAEELAKCVPLCANCHRKLHAGVIDDAGWSNGRTAAS
jgi:acetylornithine/succinyldiaminopimelate/putrescine aminotransferase